MSNDHNDISIKLKYKMNGIIKRNFVKYMKTKTTLRIHRLLPKQLRAVAVKTG
jgi:hypothetical protein